MWLEVVVSKFMLCVPMPHVSQHHAVKRRLHWVKLLPKHEWQLLYLDRQCWCDSTTLTVFCWVACAGVHGPAHLGDRIEAFLDEFAGTLAGMAAGEWDRHRQALIQAKLQKEGSIGDEAERFWELIASRR